ncbi:MAG: tetratricopeptide repeat protein [Acidobacteriota bacterium]
MEDKFKILRNAERFVVNRQYDRAVTEYRKIVETLGEDPSVLNTLGDLLLKTGKRDEALDSFRKVAEIFTQSGFVSKAIAIYRKVDELGPGNRDVVRKLAELYARRGLPNESLRFWRKLSRILEEQNDTEALISARRHVLELDEGNPEAHSKLAEALASVEPDEASSEWLSAARLLRQEEALAEAREAAQRALALNATNIDARELIAEVDEKLPPETEGEAPGNEAEPAPEEAMGDADQERAPEPVDEPEMDEPSRDRAESWEEPEPFAPTADAPTLELEAPSAEGEPSSAESWQSDGGALEVSNEAAGMEAETFDLTAPAQEITDWGEDDSGAFFGDQTDEVGTQETGEDEADGFWQTEPTEVEAPDGPEPGEAPSDVLDDLAAAVAPDAEEGKTQKSLESSLEEVDFYLKLDLRSDAVRVVKELLETRPDDERVLMRARKLGLVEPPAGPDSPPADAFDSHVDSALEDLFFEDSVLKQSSEGRIAELESRSEELRSDPRSQYDLGVAYREMGMLEDAASKFESAYQLFSDAENPEQALLCSSMLASTYLRLQRFDKSVEWADIGLSLPHVEGFERKSLEYDRAVSLEQLGEFEESLNGFRRIHEMDPEFKDVRERLARMVHEPE